MRQRNSHDQMLPLSKRRTEAQMITRAERIAARVGQPRREPVVFPFRPKPSAFELPTLWQEIQRKTKRDWS